MKNGFSLLELSIVLVIIGLIAGGIVAGSSMIRAAELRAVITEYNQFKTATYTFRDKYLALPGDIRNATAFWGDNTTHCADAAVADGTPGTCNGDGDSLIEFGPAASQEGEIWMYWQHLSNAELISGEFTGLAGGGSSSHSVLDENVPESKFSGAGWTIQTWNNVSTTSAFVKYYKNHFVFGASGATNSTSGLVLTPAEAWGIDKKIDDGKPGTGSLMVSSITTCTNAANNTDYDTDYRLDSDDIACPLRFITGF